MELRFLGETYFKSQQHILTIASKVKARYRRREYNLRVPVAFEAVRSPDSQLSAFIYKYRGVSYIKEHYPVKPQKTLVRH